MKISKLACIAMAALFSAACTDEFDEEEDEFNDEDLDDADEIDENNDGIIEWHADLAATDVYAPITGDADVRMNIDEAAFTAGVTIRNAVPGGLHPWHVHVGTCGSGGPIVGSDGAYPRLGVGNDGAAVSEVQIRVGLDPQGAYHVNVHYSDAEFMRIIACGNLVRGE
jgi:hypothetical protein